MCALFVLYALSVFSVHIDTRLILGAVFDSLFHSSPGESQSHPIYLLPIDCVPLTIKSPNHMIPQPLRLSINVMIPAHLIPLRDILPLHHRASRNEIRALVLSAITARSRINQTLAQSAIETGPGVAGSHSPEDGDCGVADTAAWVWNRRSFVTVREIFVVVLGRAIAIMTVGRERLSTRSCSVRGIDRLCL